MPLPILRRLLFALSGLCLLAAGGLVFWAWQHPVPTAVMNAPTVGIAPTARTTPLDEVMSVALRPAAAAVAAPPPPTVPLRIRLAGTILDPEAPQAMIVDGRGQMVFAKIGEELEGAKILAIAATQIEVEYQGRRQTLEVAP